MGLSHLCKSVFEANSVGNRVLIEMLELCAEAILMWLNGSWTYQVHNLINICWTVSLLILKQRQTPVPFFLRVTLFYISLLSKCLGFFMGGGGGKRKRRRGLRPIGCVYGYLQSLHDLMSLPSVEVPPSGNLKVLKRESRRRGSPSASHRSLPCWPHTSTWKSKEKLMPASKPEAQIILHLL